ncbi:MAG: hypothetical protein IT406_03455 [Candidatus Yanofskybacteria bacterium]|nr:hypothetical protein [Candidatus Yanofskybacteria bacterium]
MDDHHVRIHRLDDVLKDAYHERVAYNAMPRGEHFRDLSTVIITAVRGDRRETRSMNCPKCNHLITYEHFSSNGFHPMVVESWKRMIRPMNQPIVEVVSSGYEVGDAYEHSIEAVLNNPDLAKFKYILFIEDDMIIPWMPGTRGPLFELYRHMDTYDVAGALYWTKGEVSMPLIFGDPARGTDNYEALTNWDSGDVVECNGTGMGFTLFKMDLFKDARVDRPWFHTLQNVDEGGMTQDLYFYRKIRRLGYRICVDTSIKCGHLDVRTGQVY